MSAPLRVKAIYDYASQEPDDLSFPAGQIINITEVVDADWYEGEYKDASGNTQSGIFPNNFVEKYEPEIPTRPTRAARPKSMIQSPPPADAAPEEDEEDEPEEQIRSPPPPTTQKAQAPPPAPAVRDDPPPAPKPAPVEPAPVESKKPPPPIAPKSNAFKDRIAAFNQPAAAPILPFVPGGKQQPSYVKKPFVAPPPSSNAYVPPPKVEPVHKPYVRGEDPEIRQRQEEDRAAAESAGLTADTQQGEEGEDAPKPQSLKERIAMLQRQQQEQAQRRAEGTPKKKPSVQKPSEASESSVAHEAEGEELERTRSPEAAERQSLDEPRAPVPRKSFEPTISAPPVPEQEILSGGEEADQSAAGDTTDDAGTIGHDENDERPLPPPRAAEAPKQEPDVGDEEGAAEEPADDEAEEDDMDDETRRRMELRERMAKMSGGMGMGAMFGPPGGMPMPGAGPAPPKKRGVSKEKRSTDDPTSPISPSSQQQRIPMIPVPGMQRVQSPAESERTQLPSVEKEQEPERAAISGERDEGEVPDVEDVKPQPPPRAEGAEERVAAPPVPRERPQSQIFPQRGAPPSAPGDRPVPRPPAPELRPVPPPPPAAVPMSPGPGSESDDERSIHRRDTEGTPIMENPLPIRQAAPPVPGSRELPKRSAQSPLDKRASYFGSESSMPASSPTDKRSSRIPPIPASSPLASPRPPPPPPPPTAAPPSRQDTNLQPPPPEDDDRGESEYEGDYDTDIASGATHKDALKSHAREASLDGSTTADDTPVTSPGLSGAPPLPIHRAVPPPPPSAPQVPSRQSMDAPRAPPPMPPSRDLPPPQDEEEYDPYRYTGTSRPVPPPPAGIPVIAPPVPPREQEVQDESSDDMYGTSGPPPRKSMDRPPPPPPSQAPPQDQVPPMPATQQAPPSRAPPKQSLDVQRTPTVSRRSMDQSRGMGDRGQIATDLDLNHSTQWWTAPSPLPPSMQSRNGVDLLSECEESTTSKRGGRTTVSKDIYILFLDYSQTVITAHYDAHNPSDISLEQRHEAPAPKLRQDQLEAFWQRFGRKINETATSSFGGSKKESSTIGDGSPHGLVFELICKQTEALLPVGTRAYGATVYSNLANASVQQFDEIRPGDVVTLRNAKFEGKHSGPMHQKYKQETGPAHVGLVHEWDGTRKKIRVWEQGFAAGEKPGKSSGKERGGVRSESYRLGDLKSGEVRVWRVVGREWVGWDTNN